MAAMVQDRDSIDIKRAREFLGNGGYVGVCASRARQMWSVMEGSTLTTFDVDSRYSGSGGALGNTAYLGVITEASE